MRFWDPLPERIAPGDEARALFPFHRPAEAPAYLDHACMTPKSDPVVQAMTTYLTRTPVCGSRSAHRLGIEVTRAVADTRSRLLATLGAPDGAQAVFTRNATEAINLVARGLDLSGGTVLTSDREHNSNLVPWQRWHDHEVVPSTPEEDLDLGALETRLARGDVGLVSLVHVSNLDGHELPMREAVQLAHDHGVPVLADGAQALAHGPVDLADLGADWYAVSLHKAGGPSGVGALVAAPGRLEDLSPLILGGSTVRTTTHRDHELLDGPARFEAGLQDYGGLIASGAALDLLDRIGGEALAAHETRLGHRLAEGLADLGAEILGAPAARHAGCCSVTFEGVDPAVLAALLEAEGVLVRNGRHCVHSWFEARGVNASVRFSLWATSTAADVDRALAAVEACLPAARLTSG